MGSVTIRGGVMSPRVVLGAPPDQSSGIPPLPNGMGEQPIWYTVHQTDFGWEFRLAVDFATVMQPVAPSGDDYVYVAWVPSDERAGANPVFAALAPGLTQSGLLRAYWDCDEVDGTLRPRLDDSPEADAVRAAWPADWRVRLDTDEAEGPATGPLMLGAVLA